MAHLRRRQHVPDDLALALAELLAQIAHLAVDLAALLALDRPLLLPALGQGRQVALELALDVLDDLAARRVRRLVVERRRQEGRQDARRVTDARDLRRRKDGRQTQEEVVDRQVGRAADEDALVLDRHELPDDLGSDTSSASVSFRRGNRRMRGGGRTSTSVCVLPVPGGPWMQATSSMLSTKRTASCCEALSVSSNHSMLDTVSKSGEKEAGARP